MATQTSSWLDYSNPDITFVDSSLSCHTGFYIPHLVFSYMVGFSGLLCLLTRLHPRLHCAHVWFGRIYLLSMLWATAMSILIHNHGLPLGVLWSFLWVLGGLTIGWIAIIIYQGRMQRQALNAVSQAAAASPSGLTGNLVQQVAEEKKRIAESRTFWQRMLSLKTVHGLFMFLSWINIFGRILATRPPRDFTCWTYPVSGWGAGVTCSSPPLLSVHRAFAICSQRTTAAAAVVYVEGWQGAQ